MGDALIKSGKKSLENGIIKGYEYPLVVKSILKVGPARRIEKLLIYLPFRSALNSDIVKNRVLMPIYNHTDISIAFHFFHHLGPPVFISFADGQPI